LDIDPFSHAFLTNPYPGYDQMREAGPVVWLSHYGIYASTRHAEVRTVMSDHANYISSAGVGLANFNKEPPFRPKSLILEADPPGHTKVRAVLARILSPKAVSQIRESFAADAESLIHALVLRAAQGEVVDGVKDLAEPYPLKVFPDAVGLDAQGRENLLLYGDMIFNSFGPRNDLLARAAAKIVPVTAWIMAHCQRSMLRSFLSAGVDTTVNGIGNALLCLAQHPEQYAKLRAPSRAWHATHLKKRCAWSLRCNSSFAPQRKRWY
jgi:4-methoxybenzoate monooxygenase (O-demethylating)